jgi:hypothetical protein
MIPLELSSVNWDPNYYQTKRDISTSQSQGMWSKEALTPSGPLQQQQQQQQQQQW